MALTTYVELSVACCNLPEKVSECAVICCLLQKNETSWTKLTQTETVYKSTNPRFADSLKVEYRSGVSCYYKLAVFAAKSESVVETLAEQLLIAEAEFVIDELFTSTAKLELKLTSQGIVIPDAVISIFAEVFDHSKYDITMQLFCTKLQKKDMFGGKTDAFLEISKLQKDGTCTLVHRTDVIRNSVNPRWSTFSEPIWKLCGNQWDRQLLFCVYRWNKNGKHETIGFFYTTLEEICSQEEYGSTDIKEIKLMSKGRKRYETVGTFHFASVRAVPVYSLLDYVKNGFDIKLTLAIDYTQHSNGTPSSSCSLHNAKNDQDNEYIYCIKALMSLMNKYNYVSKVASYGFGACLVGSEVASDCFPLNGNSDNPCIDGIENVIDAYQDQLKSVRLHGLANYSKILDKVIEQALLSVSREDKTYHHLVMLTDGVVNDKVDTANRIVLASSLPLSITIISVGTVDFPMMATSSSMDDSHGKAATRNIVKFVPLRECIESRETNFSLSDEIDRALSNQFLEYMKMHTIKPKKFRPSLSSLSSAVAQSSEWQPYLQRASVSSSVFSATVST